MALSEGQRGQPQEGGSRSGNWQVLLSKLVLQGFTWVVVDVHHDWLWLLLPGLEAHLQQLPAGNYYSLLTRVRSERHA